MEMVSPKFGFAAHPQTTRTALSRRCPHSDQANGVVSSSQDAFIQHGLLTGKYLARFKLSVVPVEICDGADDHLAMSKLLNGVSWQCCSLVGGGLLHAFQPPHSPKQGGCARTADGKGSARCACYRAAPQGPCGTALPGLRQPCTRDSSNVLIG